MISDRDKLEFLLDILKESGKWSRSDDDPTGLELEFNERLKQLLSVPTDRLVGPGDPDGVNPRERRVKIKMPDGTWQRFPESELEKVPCKCSHTGFKWQVKSPEPQV
jgi:hypothetical protein